MVFFNYALRKLNAKIVYYGPGLCGKTTNLQWIHDHMDAGSCGKMVSLATEGDRTIFFDLLPLDIGTIRGMDVTLQLYTVPGQVHYNATRQLVLRGADGVVFVADSQRAMLGSNRESWANLKENLRMQGVELASFPHAIQFNKRDLREIMPVEDLDEELNEYAAPIFEAVAVQGIGVQESLESIVKLVMRSLRDRYEVLAKRGATGRAPAKRPEPAAPPTPAWPSEVEPAADAPPPRRADAPAAFEGNPDESPAVTHPALENEYPPEVAAAAQRNNQIESTGVYDYSGVSWPEEPALSPVAENEAEPEPSEEPVDDWRPQEGAAAWTEDGDAAGRGDDGDIEELDAADELEAPSEALDATAVAPAGVPAVERDELAAVGVPGDEQGDVVESPGAEMGGEEGAGPEASDEAGEGADRMGGEVVIAETEPGERQDVAVAAAGADSDDTAPETVPAAQPELVAPEIEREKPAGATAPSEVVSALEQLVRRGVDPRLEAVAPQGLERPGEAAAGSPLSAAETREGAEAPPHSAPTSGGHVPPPEFESPADEGEPSPLDDPFAVPDEMDEEPGVREWAGDPFATGEVEEQVAELFAAEAPPLPEVEESSAAQPWSELPAAEGAGDGWSGGGEVSAEVAEEDLFVDRDPVTVSGAGGKRALVTGPGEDGASEPGWAPAVPVRGDERVVVVGDGDPFGEPFEESAPGHAPERVRAAASAVLVPAAGSAIGPSVAGVQVLPGDNQLHVRLEGTGALAESGQVRELDIVVPVPGGWIGNRRVTLQLRLTLTPAMEGGE